MIRIRQWHVQVVVALLFGLGLSWVKLNQPPQVLEKPVLTDLNGQLQPLEQWQGRYLLVNFWASWCRSCIEEMPLLNMLNKSVDSDKLQLVGIALDEPDAVAKAVQQFQLTYPVLIADEQGLPWSVALGNQLQGLPFTVLVSPSGLVLQRYLGKLDEKLINKIIRGMGTGG